jgi:hypothetical protein
MADPMLFFNLDITQLESLVRRLTATLDKEVGKGKSSEVMIDWMAGETHDFLFKKTHKWTNTLFDSYLVNKREGRARGIYDPGGLVREIIVDPSVVNPEGDRPAEYAGREYDRGGTHDTFDWVSAQFEGFFDEGFELFEGQLAQKLGF